MVYLYTSILSFANVVGMATIIGSMAAVAALFFENRKLSRKSKKLDSLNPSLEVFANFKEVWNKAKEIFNEELKYNGALKVKNIGLDLEKILPEVKDFIVGNIKNNPGLIFSYSGLIINPDSYLIEPLINEPSNIKTEYVISAHKKLREYQELFKNNVHVKFAVKPYNLPPVIHGISINKRHLFLGFTEIRNGKLFGSECPYIYLKYDRTIPATEHYFTFFNLWFNHYWNYEHNKKD